MTSLLRRRRQLNKKENNLTQYLTRKEGEREEEGPVGGTRKGLSLRTIDKDNLECVLEIGHKSTKPTFNNKENVSPNIGTESTETHSLKLRQDSKNITDTSKNSSPPVKEGHRSSATSASSDDTPVSSQLSADEIILFLTQEEPGEKYFKILAEQRRKALKETLLENEKLSAENEQLRQKSQSLQDQLDSALELVQLYEKIIEESNCPPDTRDTHDTPDN